MPNPHATKTQQTFQEDYERVMHGLRGSLASLLVGAGLDPTRPQEVARHLSVSRTLTWKASRVITAGDLYSVFPQVPGPAGMETLLAASASAGVKPEVLEAARSASSEFEQMVRTHADDRATMELMIDGLSSGGALSEPLEASRKLAFRGNSGIWGVQAKIRLRTVFLAPNQLDPSQVDVAEVTGLIQFRRFRPDAVVPLFKRAHHTNDGEPIGLHDEPLEPRSLENPHSRVLTSLSSSPIPTTRVVALAEGERHEVAEGLLGNRGAATLAYGALSRQFDSRYQSSTNRHRCFITDINAPAETLIFDLVVHKDLADEADWEALLFRAESPTMRTEDATNFPTPESIQRVNGPPNRLLIPLLPNYGKMIESTCSRLRGEFTDYVGLRFEMKYPPMLLEIALRYELPVQG